MNLDQRPADGIALKTTVEELGTLELRGMIAAISSITAVGLSISLASPLLSFEIEHRGISATLNVFNGAIYGIAALIMTTLIFRSTQPIGFTNLMLTASLVSTLSLLLIYFAPEFCMWFPLKFLGGASVSVLFVLSEYWINASVPANKRGFILGVCATGLCIGFAASPVIIHIIGTDDIRPYLVGFILMLAAALPVFWEQNYIPKI